MDYLKVLATTVIDFVCDILPTDALQEFLGDLIMEASAVLTGLSWLNWLVDINGINLIFDMWLLGMAAYYVFKYGVNIFNGGASVFKDYAGLPDDE